MKATFQRSELLPALERAAIVTPAKTSFEPFLRTRLLPQGDGGVLVGATNGVMSVSETVSAEKLTGPAIQVPGRDLAAAVKRCPEGLVKLEARDLAVLHIEGQGVRVRLPCTGADEHEMPPLLEAGEHAGKIELDGTAFSEELHRLFRILTFDDTRPIACVLVEVGDGKVRFYATDGHRAMRVVRAADPAFTGTITIPSSNVADLSKTLTEVGPVTAHVADRAVTFVARDGRKVSSMLAEHKAPQIEKVIPKRSGGATMDRAQTLDALKRAALGKDGHFDVQFAGGVTVTWNATEGTDTREARVDVSEETIDSDLIRINSGYMIDALSMLPGDEVRWTQGDRPVDPTMLASQVGDATYTAIVMPMSVR